MRDRNEHIIQMYCIDNQVSSLQELVLFSVLYIVIVSWGVVMTSSWGEIIDNTFTYFCIF